MLYVLKRDGRKESVQFDKITERISKLISPPELVSLSESLDVPYLSFSHEKEFLDPILVAQKVVASLYPGIITEELDIESAEICVNLSTTHPAYSNLGGRILISNLHKKTLNNFSSKMLKLSQETNIINSLWLSWVLTNAEQIDKIIDYNRDYLFDYFGFKTLEKSYLLKSNGHIIERPQDIIMRNVITVSIDLNTHFINDNNEQILKNIKESYDYLSLGYYTHASPTLFNSGTNYMQLSSCFVENTEVMTMSGIKNIQEVKINDMIVTHTGKVKKVLQIHKNPLNNRKIFNLKVHKTKQICVTDNHRFWTISKNNNEPCWKKISELSIDNYIAIPSYNGTIKLDTINIEQLIKDNNITNCESTHLNNDQNINNIISIDENVAIIFGIFVSKGHIITKDNKILGIGFTVYYDNIKEIEFIQNTIEKSFNIKTSFHYLTRSVTQLLYNSQLIGQLFNYMFDIKFNEKHIYSNMINWDINLIYNFLVGLITVNSCIYKEDNFICKISNYNLMNQLYHLFRLYGIDVEINDVLSSSKLETVTPCILFIPKIEYVLEMMQKISIGNRFKLENCINKIDHSMSIIVNNVKFLKINELYETDKNPDYVYTIGVDEDHSYNVEGLICENCFLLGTLDDLNAITTTWNSCALISKYSGGIGLHVSNIRSNNSIIKGTGGKSNGLVPLLKIFNDIARWVDQGGKRPGSIAIYLEPHHSDIFEFLDLRKNFGSETERARDLFLALWVSDLFMKQVESGGDWYLLSADECPGLDDVYGDDYENLYWKYVNENKFRKKIEARKLWHTIMETQIETGLPYICYKDAVNHKSNQKNLGTIKSSNLCAEITEYSDDKEYAVCNLASIALKPFVEPFKISENSKFIIYTKTNCKFCVWAKKYLSNIKVNFEEISVENNSLEKIKELLNKDKITWPQIFIESENSNIHIGGWSELYTYTAGKFNFDKLYKVAYTATINLNKVIDVNYYPVPQTKLSNMKHRPVGLGIQGLADTLALMRIPFDSDNSIKLNGKIMETIYLAALTASNDIAKSRYIQMNTLIDYFCTNKKTPPEFYDPNINYSDQSINNIYHLIRPNIWELSREISTRTGSYSSFDGSPFSQGKFQFDLWKNNYELHYVEKWNELRINVIKYGVRNSLLTALMPTASTSQILGNNECFEFFTNNIYTRKTQAGDFMLVNKYLVNDLIKIGLWNLQLKNKIITCNGSIQSIDEIPEIIKELYKTIWEIKQIWSLKNAAARGPFVDQTQSLNIFIGEPDYQRLNSSHFWAWKAGLKTGMYYLRSKAAVDAIKFTIDPLLIKQQTNEQSECVNCSS